MNMQVTELANEGLKRAYTVVVPADQIAEKRSTRLAALAKDMKIPGFRPGKVPVKVVEQRYGQAIQGEVLEQSVQEAAQKVVTDRGLRPADQPKIELVKFEDGSDLEFRVDLEVLPEIKMPDFGDIALEKLVAKPTDEQIEKALQSIAERNRTLDVVAESRPAEKGEVLVCDFVGRVDGEEFPGGKAEDMPIEVAGAGFIPGFTEPLEGMSPGEEKVIQVTFPEEYGAKELAGKAAEFTIKAKALQVPVVPPVDDALAKAVGLEDLATLKARITEQLQGEYDGLARLKVKRSLLDALSEKTDFPVPEGMVEREFNQIWERVEADKKADRLDEEDKGKDEETLKADYQAIAQRRIRLGLLLSEIGRTNNIQVTPDELARAARQEAMRYPGQEKQVMDFFSKNPQAAESLRAPIFEEKVVDFLLELAKVEEKEVSPEALAEAAQAA